MFSPYVGKEYSQKEMLGILNHFKNNVEVTKMSDHYMHAADQIAHGKIIGWFQGRSEGGPRALGNRSILADPRNPKMKDILNARIKFRESFRPFAPSVLYEHQMDFFDLDIPSPYMLMVADIWPEKRELIPAVTHVDGTGRIQTVMKNMNYDYYQLIEAFYQLTDIPIVLNTSFNINKEPIVESPYDAVNCFLHTELDALYLGEYYVKKK